MKYKDPFDLKIFLGEQISIADFKNKFWQKKSLHIPADPARLRSLPTVENFEELIKGLDNLIVAMPEPKNEFLMKFGYFPDLQGLKYHHANTLRSLGGILVVVEFQKHCVEMSELASSIKSELNILGDFAVGVWQASSGGGFGMHTDAEDVFTLQVAGSKKWKISKTPFHIRSALALIDSKTARKFDNNGRAEEIIDIDMDDSDFVEITLNPGDVLYLPPFTWHGTSSVDSYTMSVNMRAKPKPFYAPIFDLLEINFGGNNPIDNEIYRSFSTDLVADARARLQRIFAEASAFSDETLLMALNQEICTYKGFQHGKRAHVALSPETRLCRNFALPSKILESSTESGARIDVFFHDKQITFDEADQLPFIRKLYDSKAFRAKDCLYWHQNGQAYEWETIKEYLEGLIEIGFLLIPEQ